MITKDDTLKVKNYIEGLTGLKISVKKEKENSSLRGYVTFKPRKPTEWTKINSDHFLKKYKGDKKTFCNRYSLSVYFGEGIYQQ